ncbi:MAG: hypothetical protein JXA71_02345 [Chitinispirillaceae bacterium]|nr:hypothetical protein [Chitinispirillaceae bacterium]
MVFFSAASAPDMSDQEYVDALKKSITLEEKAWYEKQHEQFRADNLEKPFFRSEQRISYQGRAFSTVPSYTASGAPTPVSRVLILANRTLYANATVKTKVDRYMQDIAAGHGCRVVLEQVEGGTAVGIKDLIKSYYNNGGLDGVIQIGSLPVAWMEFKSDPFFQKYETWTCDHFYCDLDGQWVDADNNTFYDAHNPGTGDRGSEIFYARIDVKPMGSFGTEVQMCCDYLDKVHNYWVGGVTLRKSAIDLIEPDWSTSVQNLQRVYGTENTTILRNPGAYSRDQYLNTHIQGNYSFLHLWCHSGYTAHSFSNGGSLNYTTVYNANPKPIGYAHDGCHLADWAAAGTRGYLGGAYVFNKSPTALVCIAGSRTGQWIGNKGQRLFEEIGKNTCVGKAYQVWFDAYCNSSEMTRDVPYFMAWNYGMLILGDPMLTFIIRLQTGTAQRVMNRAEPAAFLRLRPTASGLNRAITFNLPQQTDLTVRVYELSGKTVFAETRENQQAGPHEMILPAARLPQGTYIVSLDAGSLHLNAPMSVSR